MDKQFLGEEWQHYRFWGNGTINRASMVLMVAMLLLIVPVQPRAQSTDEVAPADESVAGCPCGNPAELIPLAMWPTTVVDCAADSTRTTVYGFSHEGGIASLESTTYGRNCQFVVDAINLNGQQQRISKPQVAACSNLILSYAQALRDAGRVAVSDVGCKLR